MKYIKQIVAMTVAFIIGSTIGAVGTIFLYERITMVDYEGGAVHEVIRVGPLTLHEVDLPMTAFQLIPLQESVSLSTEHDWHVAHRVGAWSQVSPSTKGGEVLSVMTDLSSVTNIIGLSKASEIKTQFIHDLKLHGPYIATETAKKSILKAVDAVTRD